MDTSISSGKPVGIANPTILLVDDEPALQRMLSDLLGSCGYRVLVAGDAEQALTLAESCGPDRLRVLVTDQRLPGASGLDLAARLQQDHPDLGVIYMSGFAQDLMADPAGRGPRCRILEKPFPAARLIELVSELLA